MTQRQVIEKQRRFLLVYAQRRGITQACRAFGVSRTTYYKIKKQFLETGSLAPKPRRKPRMPNETALRKKKLLLRMVQDNPEWGPDRYVDAFRDQGICISKSCVWHHLSRFGLNRRYQRLVYFESLQSQKQPVTERSLRQLRKRFNTIKRGLWPGHLVALDTFFVGHLKGVGRIYQVSGIDLCSRYGWAHLYQSKEQSSAVEFLENRLLPKFYHNGVDLEGVLTDNGGEFTGRKFQELLEAYGIRHYRIPKGKPICNGYCERFQRTILEEFYKRAFRRRFFNTLEELQKELDQYLVFYNFKRKHFGLDPKGAIPVQAFKSQTAFLRRRFQKLLT